MRLAITYPRFWLLACCLSLAAALPAQGGKVLVRTNLLTLPQPSLTGEIEYASPWGIGVIFGASTRNALPALDNLGWFRNGEDRCDVRTHSLHGGLSYFQPLDERWEVGGKVLYQQARTMIFEETCEPDFPNLPALPDLYTTVNHSVNVLPAARFYAMERLFFEAALGLGYNRNRLNTGDLSGSYWTVPAQLNVGFTI